jgi:site-specific recombinase XerD
VPKTEPLSPTVDAQTLNSLNLSDLLYQAEGWLLDGEIRQMSARTLANRRDVVRKLHWFAEQKRFTRLGPNELRTFFLYMSRPAEAGGRWGNPRQTGLVKPGTVATYFNVLRTLFAHLVEVEALAVSPMAKLKPPIDRPDQIQPFNGEQVSALEAQARKSVYPQRDTAIILLLLDTGMRASELCGLRVRDVDVVGRRCIVRGKGGKERALSIGQRATRALWAHLRGRKADPDAALFQSQRGQTPGENFTRSGLTQLIHRLGVAAGVEAVRCSPHTFRHTFAVEFLRAGGNQFTLMEILGHTDLAMTGRYLKIAQADVERQHRAFSPGDRMKRRRD